MSSNMPFGSPPPETVILKLNSGSTPSARAQFLDRVYSLFEHLNWRAHLYILNGDPDDRLEGFFEIAELARRYLLENKFCTLYLHPVFLADDFSPSSMAEWDRILSLPAEFQQEAYREQGKERLIVLPVLKLDSSVTADAVTAAARFFQNRLTKPSLYFAAEPPLDCIEVLGEDIRVYVDEFSDLSGEMVTAQLAANHIFEDLLERADSPLADLLNACRRHLVIDEEDSSIFACFRQFREGQSCGLPESVFDGLPIIDGAQCADCISDSLSPLECDLRVNRRLEEGAQVSLSLGQALVDRDLYKKAIPHFERAFEFSADDGIRAAALLNQGLCYINLMEFAQADRVFQQGQQIASAPGVFLYHRGRVAMSREDYPDAAKLFSAALDAGSEDVPTDDLLFNLAVSCINTADVVLASGYLGRIKKMSPPVHFYQGICQYALGDMQAALGSFRQALQMRPAPEDLPRVLFYIGSCLKELGRYQEAIEVLDEAVLVDPSEYANHNLRGFCFFQLKDHQKSVEAFKKAIEINPRSAIDYASMGSNLRELGKIEEAIAMYRMALSIDPTLMFAAENIQKLSEVNNG